MKRGPKPNLEVNFWPRISRGHPDQCWEWQGRLRNGYGGVNRWVHGRKLFGAHRIVYASVVNAIPDGMFVLHRCDNPKCCNPEHLFLGTHQDNMNDRNTKGRAARGDRHGMVIKAKRLSDGCLSV